MAAIDLRYARALAQVVAEQKLDSVAVEQQLADFGATLNGSAELREVLQNPSIAEAQKLGVLDAIARELLKKFADERRAAPLERIDHPVGAEPGPRHGCRSEESYDP